MNFANAREMPTVFVIFGATGDLASRKIIPSLYHLYTKGKLPKLLSIVGFSRRSLNADEFREYFKDILKNHVGRDFRGKTKQDFLLRISYVEGRFEELKYFNNLAKTLGNIDGEWQVCTNKLFYLAVPPKYYKEIFLNLEASGLTTPCGPDEGWTRVIVEKPFGRDLKTAKELDFLLGKLFKEEQIFRIDHYLAKEALQNILTFRFSNNIFDQSWSNKYIDSIEVKLLETEGVEDRGAFYDGVGALRDVGQNHLLQMLALTGMDNPGAFSLEAIRREKLKILKSLKIVEKRDLFEGSLRGQYEGYKKEDGVNSDSATETYFRLKAFVSGPKWEGVPIILEGGKGMPVSKKEIVVRFKHPSPCLCPPSTNHEYHNKVIFALEPEEEITFRLWTKKPGLDLAVQKRSFDMPFRSKSERVLHADEYEKLLLDCFSGDQTLFVSTKEMEAMWDFTDPILDVWSDTTFPLEFYRKGDPDIRDKAKRKTGGVSPSIKREIGIIGLGKMGANIARSLIAKGWQVVGYNRSKDATDAMLKEGLIGVDSLSELVSKLTKPRVVWVMVPSHTKDGKAPVDDVIVELSQVLDKGDIVIDAGNSFYKNSIKNFNTLEKKGIEFIDVGVSGGPGGALYGACLMVGGKRELYDYLLPLYVDLSVPGGHAFFDGVGAGHFAKMVHNGIEYGMMQAVAEGFDILEKAEYKYHLARVARLYNHGSVIESRLLGWMAEAFEIFGDELKSVSGRAQESGEGRWTTEVAGALGIRDEVIENALKERLKSQSHPSFQGKIIQALRNRFGGHDAKS